MLRHINELAVVPLPARSLLRDGESAVTANLETEILILRDIGDVVVQEDEPASGAGRIARETEIYLRDEFGAKHPRRRHPISPGEEPRAVGLLEDLHAILPVR